jgi:hypothetical protein
MAADDGAVALRVERAPKSITPSMWRFSLITLDQWKVCSLEGRRRFAGLRLFVPSRSHETTHQAVSRGLCAVVGKIDLWEFDNALDHAGSTSEPGVSQRGRESRGLLALIGALAPPRGGDGNRERARGRDG